MKGMLPVAGGVAAVLAIATHAGPAQADTKMTGAQLVPAVTKAQDVRAFYPKVRNSDAPKPGTGADHIPTQGICFKADGTIASLAKLPKRQAWSTQMIGAGESRGLITIVNQYKSAKQAKTKLQQVKALLTACPANVVDGTETITQSWRPLALMYKGHAVATAMVAKDTGGQDSLQYVAIRQTGALLSFVRYSQVFEGTTPKSTQHVGMVEFLSGQVAVRYRALQKG